MNAIKCCTSSEIPANPSSCFAPPALKSATSAQNLDGRRVGPFSRDFLMMQLLKFASKQLRSSSETKPISESNQSQSDEIKVGDQLPFSTDGVLANTKTLLADISKIFWQYRSLVSIFSNIRLVIMSASYGFLVF